MSDARTHYEHLLAEHYSWMFALPFAEKVAEQRALLQRLQIAGGSLAIDLGAGSGFQSAALANLGFERVLAIDSSSRLLEELRSNIGARAVEPIRDDLLNFSQYVAAGTADAIVCMGDTLTHLSSHESVPQLFRDVSRALRQGGLFVLSYRDLSAELRGIERFIPVRSSPDKIMTCFLEYGPDAVMVHDLIHVRSGDTWVLSKSCYPKLRLPVGRIGDLLQQAGLKVEAHDTERGMSILAARR